MKSSLKMTTRINTKSRVARPQRLVVRVDKFDFLHFPVRVRHVNPIPARVPSTVVRSSTGNGKEVDDGCPEKQGLRTAV